MVHNIGYNSGGIYLTSIHGVHTEAYILWKEMIRRCYRLQNNRKFNTYKNVYVCDKWLDFQNFAKWYHENYIPGFHLDKDIIIKGNKIYGPDTCCFVPHEINGLFALRRNERGDLPIGVSYYSSQKTKKPYLARVVINGKGKSFGYYDTPEKAFQAYKIGKEQHIKQIADKWKSQLPDKVYQALYNYQVEITD